MRTPMIASLVMLTLVSAVPADAQRLGRGRMVAPQIGVPQINGPQYNGPITAPPVISRPAPQPNRFPNGYQNRGQNWGGRINGRWIGGVQAPGGWNSYRRPTRGYRLPGYWTAPSFFIGNFGTYGLTTPPYGYSWSRYYDDAVLIDSRGRVQDWVGDIDWDGYGDGDDDRGDRGYVADQLGYGAPYAAPGVGYQGEYQGSYTVDGRTGYQRGHQRGTYRAPPQPVVQPVYPQGYSQSWTAGSGYYYPGGVTTTITVQQAPVVTTTTTTEYVEGVEYRAPVRRSYRKPARKWRPAPKRCSCSCDC